MRKLQCPGYKPEVSFVLRTKGCFTLLIFCVKGKSLTSQDMCVESFLVCKDPFSLSSDCIIMDICKPNVTQIAGTGWWYHVISCGGVSTCLTDWRLIFRIKTRDEFYVALEHTHMISCAFRSCQSSVESDSLLCVTDLM